MQEDDKSFNKSQLTPEQSVPLTCEIMATPLRLSKSQYADD